ncbi:uncharacterized protein LOC110983630 isoform X2 [Acanthaster planci]|nr:uncharacterized protein LOC110983630 isoform X2 [Acanthaster planci]XP_022098734.1 uncharacterized protein LOC110983630 isoform X2 [Acanthaster planci]XP_022098735.1 uncharacterized protein LOC110983630 isoform X2 [Acanthaster planci]
MANRVNIGGSPKRSSATVTKATGSSTRRPRPASYHQDHGSSSTSSGSPKSPSDTPKGSLVKSPATGREAIASLALKIPPRVDRTWRRSGSPSARSSASGSSTGSSDSLPSRKATSILRKLAVMRQEEKLIDLNLVFYRGEIRCHRIVLAASSPYFRDTLAVSSHLTRHDSIEMRGVDMQVMQALVDYAYTSTVTIGYDRVKTLLEAANMFQFQSIIDACIDYLKRSRRKIRQRSSSRQRSENSVGGASPSSGGSRSASPKSTPVQSPRAGSPLTTPSPLLLSPREPFNGSSPKIAITDDKVGDVAKILQDISLEGKGATTTDAEDGVMKNNGLPSALDVGSKYSRSISTGSEGYLTSSIGSDSSNDSTTHFIFRDNRHPSHFIKAMVKLRQEGRLTDVVLRTKIKDFPCHRVVLEASSSYLSQVISRDLDGTNAMDVHMRKISPDVLQKLIHFMYTGRVAVSDRDAAQVYRAAKRFGLDDVCHSCAVVDPSLDSTSTANTSLTDSVLSEATHPGSLENLLD